MPMPWEQNAQDDNDPLDVTSPRKIAEKLQGLQKICEEKLDSPLPQDRAIKALSSWLEMNLSLGEEKEAMEKISKAKASAGTAISKEDMEDMEEYLDYADWAYLEETKELKSKLETRGCILLHHQSESKVANVAKFVAIHPDKKMAIIGVKGTSTFDDFLTDVCANAIRDTLEAPPVDGCPTEISVHEGMWIAAKNVCNDYQPYVEHMFVPLGYQTIICGHSLGAGSAALLGVLLKSKLKTTTDDAIKVMAFAAPPVLDYVTAKACDSFITTIVNNADCIPRMSISNMCILLEFLKLVDAKLQERGVDNQSFGDWLKDKVQGVKAEAIMSLEESLHGYKTAFEAVDVMDRAHLFTPGKIVYLYEEVHLLLEQKEQEEEENANVSEEEHAESTEEEKNKETELTADLANGIVSTPDLDALRVFEVTQKMITDHFTAGYYAIVRAATEKVSS